MPQTLERTYQNVITIRDDEVKKGWKRDYLLASDLHLDNPHCDRSLIKSDFDQALEREAKIFLFGDTFCAMGGKFDPRRAVANVRPENNNDFYVDSIVKNNHRYLEPYAENIWVAADGNHETAVGKNIQTNLTERLAELLGCQAMGYAGAIRFLFESEGGGHRTERILYFDHGSGGGGEMSKGALGVVRTAAWCPDANIVVKGHIHERFIMELARQRFSGAGKPYLDSQVYVQLSTYKQEFDLRGGYHKEKGRPPKPLGGAFLQFYYHPRRMGNVGFRVVWTDGGF